MALRRSTRGIVRHRVAAAAIAILVGGCGSAAPSQSGASAFPIASVTPAASPASVASPTPGQTLPPELAAALANEGAALDAIRLVPDKAHAAKVVVGAAGASATATDASGGAWTLAIPAGAAPVGAEITITPLAKIVAPTPGWAGGVLLAPDGTQFASPVNVAYRAPAGAAPTQLYQFDQTGASVQVAPTAADGSALLWHFSGVGAGPMSAGGGAGSGGSGQAAPGLPASTLEGKAEQYDMLLRAIEAGLPWSPSPQRDIPDRVPSACTAVGADAPAVAALAAAFRRPWDLARSRMAGFYADLLRAAAAAGGWGSLDKDFANRTLRAYDKLDELAADDVRFAIGQHDSAPDHGVLKYRLLSQVVPLFTVSDGSGNRMVPTASTAALDAWRGHVGGQIADKVASDHWYSAVSALAAWGLLDDATEAKVRSALHFDVTAKFEVKSIGVYLQASTTLTAKGLQAQPLPRTFSDPYVVTLTGQGSMDSPGGHATDYAGANPGEATVAASHTSTDVTLKLDVCALTMTLDAHPWGTPELITMVSDGEKLSMPYPGTGLFDSGIRTGILQHKGGLLIAAKDRQAVQSATVDLSYRVGGDSAQVDATVSITHRPG